MASRRRLNVDDYYDDDGYGDEDYYEEDEEERAIKESKKMHKQAKKAAKSKFIYQMMALTNFLSLLNL